jgi:hypothetical protein
MGSERGHLYSDGVSKRMAWWCFPNKMGEPPLRSDQPMARLSVTVV